MSKFPAGYRQKQLDLIIAAQRRITEIVSQISSLRFEQNRLQILIEERQANIVVYDAYSKKHEIEDELMKGGEEE